MDHSNNISRISVQQIIDYSTCPLKVGQRLSGDEKMTPHDLFIVAGKEAVYAYFNALAQGFYTPTAISRAVKKFDEIWAEKQNNIVYDGRLNSYSGRLLIERIATIYEPKEDEIVAVNFPIEVALSPNLILVDQIDVLIINKKSGRGGKQTIRAINLHDVDSNCHERFLDFRASVFKMAIQAYLGSQTSRHYLYELRSFTSKDRVIKPKLQQRYPVIRLATNIAKAIRQKIWYPTTSKESCKQCHLKKTCQLSLIMGSTQIS